MSFASASQSDKQVKKLQLAALRHSAFYTPYLLTFSRAYLSDKGIQVHYQPATSLQQLNDDLHNGRIHISQSAVGVSLISDTGTDADPQNKLVHFAQINCRDGFYIVARSALLEDGVTAFNWSELQNRRILADHLFQPLAMLKFALAQNNIASDSVDLIDAGDVNAMLDAFAAGEGDFIHLQGPYAQQLVNNGQGRIVAAVGDAIGPVAFSSLCCRIDFTQSTLCKLFYCAFQQALQACNDETASRLAADVEYLFPEIEPQVLRETIADYQKLGTWRKNKNANPAAILQSDYDNIIKIFLASGDISSTIPFDRYIKQPD